MHTEPSVPDTASAPWAWRHWRAPLGVGLAVCAACLLGIVLRPTGFFSAFWPANAIFLGLLVRFPHLDRPATWLCAAAGYLAADLGTGSALGATLWLSAANLLGVAAGNALFARISVPAREMRRQLSALYLFCVCSIASAVAALIGSGTGPVVFGAEWVPSLALWFSSELLNYVLITPVLLTVPARADWLRSLLPHRPQAPLWTHATPLVAVLVAEIASFVIGGPGALAFVVPALLWCALTYSRFVTSVLCMAVCSWKTLELAAGALLFTPDHWPSVFSLRVGITLLSLGPLAVACANASREEVLQKLDRAVNFDFLTEALARRAFLERSERQLARMAQEQAPAALLMLDLDHFKQVNDRHGHAAGDTLLVAFARTVTAQLRADDLFGRLGGEEFAILLPRVRPAEAEAVAGRLGIAVRALRVDLPDGATVHISVSIGLACRQPVTAQDTLKQLLDQADTLLYDAKAAGRDRTIARTPGVAPTEPLPL